MSSTEIGAILGITPRRVGQYRDDGLLPTIERGRFDLAWLCYLRIGETRARRSNKRPDRETLVCMGWLSAQDDAPSNEDLVALFGLFERNGISREAVLLAVGCAQGLLRR